MIDTMDRLSTKELFRLNSQQLREGWDTSRSGAELMSRTDTSPERIAASNAACADRRQVGQTLKGDWA